VPLSVLIGDSTKRLFLKRLKGSSAEWMGFIGFLGSYWKVWDAKKKDTASRRSAIPPVGGEEAEKEERTRARMSWERRNGRYEFRRMG
jgi:hypothetical protein